MIGKNAFESQPFSRPTVRVGAWVLLLVLGSLPFAWGQEPEIDASQMPRIPATEPAEALATFEIRPGFDVKLAAHEPDVVDPVAMVFDADGSMYVIEMIGYSERREERLGRIRYLQDRDHDGVFEHSTVFKDGLKWPTGIVCYKGGVFVGATPEIRYFKDEDGDGVSDVDRLVFTGFGPQEGRLNMQALFNSFQWGPDNRIWGAAASSGGTVTQPSDSSFGPVSLRREDFSFDPETLDFRVENGTAQYGLTFDSLGRRFVCSNSRHALWVAYERHHVRSNPYYDLPHALVDIPQDGAAAPVYRISPDEPWRIVRTRWRVSGVVQGMIEGGGRVSGYFTSASGIHAYWGGAYGEGFQNNFFIGDVGSNLVHRKRLVSVEGQVQPLAIRPEDERETEFLRSRDNWFRPVSFATGPDGCLYVCDMYRETIEHPWSLPPGVKKHVDLNSGNDRGRIYRIEPKGFARPAIPKLSHASTAELRKLALQAGDDWRQTTARRLLFERGQPLAPKAVLKPFPAILNEEASLMERFSAWKGDPWLEAAILNSLRDGDAIRKAWSEVSLEAAPSFERELAKLSGRTGDAELIEKVIERFVQRPVNERLTDLVAALKDGVMRGKGDWEGSLVRFGPLFDQARNVAADGTKKAPERHAALRLVQLESKKASSALGERILVDVAAPESLVTEAVSGITDTSFLLDCFNRLPDTARRIAGERIAKTPSGATKLLAAIEEGLVDLAGLSAEAVQSLRSHRDAAVAARAKQTLPEQESREEVVARYQAALDRSGDAERGRGVFMNACASCHQTLSGEGAMFGPPVASFASAGKASLLGNILNPNQEVAPQYQAFQFTLNNGESHVAMIAAEDSRNVTLSLPGGVSKTFPRVEVASMVGIGRSLMPEGLEQSMTIEEMTDLLAYLSQ